MKIESDSFIDTNILVYHTLEGSVFSQNAAQIIKEIEEGKFIGFISQQILNEYFSIMTNPKRINPPLTRNEACNNMESYLSTMRLVSFNGDYHNVIHSILDLEIENRDIFDLFIYWTMKSNDIESIITANERDFKIFPDIQIINPFKV